MNSSLVKKRFRKQFGRKINRSEVRELWNLFLEERVLPSLLRGNKVKLDQHNSLEIVGTPKPFKKYHLNARRMGVEYKIIFGNDMAKRPVYLNACGTLKKKVRHALCNTNHYFRICSPN